MKSKRGSYKKRGGKLKLKKNTVYTLFAIGFFLLTGLLLMSFLRNDDSSEKINQILKEKFGGVSFLFPFVPFFFAFLFLHLKKFYLLGIDSFFAKLDGSTL